MNLFISFTKCSRRDSKELMRSISKDPLFSPFLRKGRSAAGCVGYYNFDARLSLDPKLRFALLRQE